MDSKKNSNANLERYRFTFLLVGLTISLGLVILIFQWRFFEPNLTKHLKSQRETLDTELPPVYVLREVPVKKESFAQKKKTTSKDPIKTKPKKLVAVSNKVDVPSIIEPLDSLNWSGSKEIENPIPTSYLLVEKKPVFPGCEGLGDEESMKCFEEKILKHIKDNATYPKVAKEYRVEEKVFVSFIIDKQGYVSNIEVIRGKDKLLVKEAERVISVLPQMSSPAMQRGKSVPVSFAVPINFKLN